MKATTLMITFFIVNIVAVGATISLFVPSAPEGLALREVSIQRPANDSPALVKGKPTQLSIESIDLDIDVIDV